jgi:hypothetical protein
LYANEFLAPVADADTAPGWSSTRPARDDPARIDGLTASLSAYSSVSLAETNRVSLLNRHETKYLMARRHLAEVLAELGDAYAVLEIEGRRVHAYRTLYFDTEDFAMFRRHHAGGLNRYKVRTREYVDSGECFLEIKHKTNKRRTIKSRWMTPHLLTQLDGESAAFLAEACPYHPQQLAPCLWSSYRRVTLVNRSSHERVTIDLDIALSWQGKTVDLAPLAVAEVKHDSASALSPFILAMRDRRIHRTGFSKYCTGVSLLHAHVRANRFKLKLRLIDKLMRDDKP